MRGKALSGLLITGQGRITPAYAGKSQFDEITIHTHWDHPRVCGEKWHTTRPERSRTGSPPRMRGKADASKCVGLRLWITPAYAGKSSRAKMELSRNQGSPPRMRGKDSIMDGLQGVHGITPAYAGKRLKRSRSTVPPVAIVPLFPSVCNKPVVSDGSPAGRDAPLFLPAENAVPASPAYNLRSL